ncbi:hypothetical protein A3A64_02895 [Candidatus Gottesmanbacteria bacterium RIFCSPLOWO2_01_FULL_48_11]|uniref:Uncharacterized protein n=1 Tax=Candidatus Gottesmanbacteria bacterium RIFCSPLOWO2_01_FULL_48_11 TaxID=1798395 RepID=A0A1F6ATF0_9BACT|nr:MAG: hypothetical protein A3A64_02895 [Candidatus Gottesmanbacteria bacterium RIFCSPLOWO2_01_FULL_48_11]
MKKNTKKYRDPQPGANATREELAKFWDTHSFADYWDEFKPVKVRFAKNLSEGATIRFDDKTLTKLRKVAAKKGMGPTTLARMWILERLQASA